MSPKIGKSVPLTNLSLPNYVPPTTTFRLKCIAIGVIMRLQFQNKVH